MLNKKHNYLHKKSHLIKLINNDMTAKKRLNARDSKSRSFGSACSIQA